jgi:hypothetical protein
MRRAWEAAGERVEISGFVPEFVSVLIESELPQIHERDFHSMISLKQSRRMTKDIYKI